MICVYHNKDLDGYCSGAIVKRKYPAALMLGWDYGQPLPFEESEIVGQDVILIDISFPISKMLELSCMTKSFTWIDHHISAINEYRDYPDDRGHKRYMTAILENGIAACEGGWKYLFPDEFMPTAVMLAGKYDTWRNQDKYDWENAILPFQYGMRMFCTSPETFPPELLDWYDNVTDNPVYKIIHEGKLILSYQKTQNERACKSSFETVFEGLRAICLNNGGANSQVFDSVYDESKHDLMIPFVFTGKHWTFSLYTTKKEIDCSVIAKSKGGGGHKMAAGFQLKELPDEFKIHIV